MAQNREAGAIRPTLFIGLGGTGKEVLLRLRRKFFESFGEPGLPCTSYLWLDTDTKDVMAQGEPMDEIYKEVRFTEPEQVQLLKSSVGTDLSQIFNNRDRFGYIHRWLYPQVEQFGQEISDGAGNVRAVGRLTWFYRYGDIETRVGALARNSLTNESITSTRELFLKRNWTVPDFITDRQAIVVFSVVGGTGAGTFLDTAFLLRRTGLFGQIIGICVLPNIYFQDRHNEQSARSYANSYAALKELEYYTVRRTGPADADAAATARTTTAQPAGPDAGLGSVDFEVQWERAQDRKIPGPPFHVVYMVERQNETGIGLRSRPEFFKMLAESMYMDYMPGQFSTNKRSSHSNVRQMLASPAEDHVKVGEAVLPQTFSRRYASFGMSKLEIPLEALKAACSCQLAADLARYWARECKDMDILRSVRQDMNERHLSLEGLAGRFVPNWKDEVRREVDRVGGPLSAAKHATLDDVETARQATLSLEDSYLGAAGTSIDPERNLPHRFGVRAPQVLEEVKKQLAGWLDDCLEKPERGLRGLLMTQNDKGGGRKGYLQSMMELLQQTFVSEKSDCVQRRNSAETDAEGWAAERDRCFEQLKTAVTDTKVDILRQRPISVQILSAKMIDAEKQYLLAKAEVALYDLCREVARQTIAFLGEKTVQLGEFSKAIDGLPQPFLDLRGDYLRPGDEVLFIQVFDEAEDWPKFYKLGGAEVMASNEAKLMQGTQTLYKLYEVWREQGIDHLRSGLRAYCDKRFIDDFRAHPREVNLLQHPKMRGAENMRMRAQQLVAAGLSRAQLSNQWGHGVRPKRDAYIGIAEDTSDQRRQFARAVRDTLLGQGFTDDMIHELPTTNKGEAYLYTVNYAFPLSMIQLIGQDCHETYYTFYHELRRGQVGGTKQYYRIPVHIDKRWEGKFDDLTWMQDEEARRVKEVYEILLFGALLGVTYRQRDKEMTTFGYRRRRMGSLVPETWGGRREATEFLKGDGTVRRRFLNEIARREEALTPEQLRAYAMAMRYLFRIPGFGSGTVEATLLEEREKAMEKVCARAKVELATMPDGNDPEDLWDFVSKETGGLLVKAQNCEVPLLKDMPVWDANPEA